MVRVSLRTKWQKNETQLHWFVTATCHCRNELSNNEMSCNGYFLQRLLSDWQWVVGNDMSCIEFVAMSCLVPPVLVLTNKMCTVYIKDCSTKCSVSLSLEWVCPFHSDYDGVRTGTKLEMQTDQWKGTSRHSSPCLACETICRLLQLMSHMTAIASAKV